MSNLHDFAFDLLKYLSLPCKLLNVLFSYNFFFLFLVTDICLPLLLLTAFSIPRPQESLIEVEPISSYIYTKSVLCCPFFFPPSPSYWNFVTPRHKTRTQKRTQTNSLITHQTFNSRGTRSPARLFHTARQISLTEATHAHCVCCTHAEDSLCLPETAIPGDCMSQPPVVCILTDVFLSIAV